MNLNHSVVSVEIQYQQILEDFFVSIYDERNLPSHGIYHHRRVWNNAKELLGVRADNFTDISSLFLSKLIIASYLHDIGMSVEKGVRHGVHSRKLCLDFLLKHNLPESEYQDLLETVENHDRKDYIFESKGNELLTILSVADDLDAFGFSGIYRYCEIYILRGIKPDVIGQMIIENATKRFDHFVSNFGSDKLYLQKQRGRFGILIRFFTGYNKQLASYTLNSGNPSGYCGVVEMFINMINDKTDINELLDSSYKLPDDNIVKWYIEGLRSEML
jgi:HD superfamily phosphodiesterase